MKYIECGNNIAFDYILKYNIFLTGPPGSGKSYITKEYIDYCKNNKIPVAITASTGIAAKQINGSTIHSWSGIEIVNNNDEYDKILQRVIKKPNVVRRWKRVKVLIIDEISLLDCKIFDFLNKIGQYIRNNNMYFGGIQLLIVGDFYQLPPINGTFCFMSDEWDNIFDYGINLNTIFRSNDIRLNKILKTIRKAKPLKKNMIKLLESKKSNNPVYPILTPLREDARYYNEQKLNENKNKEHIHKAIFSENCISNEIIKKTILNISPLEEILVLKKDCTVVCIVNDAEKGLVNGMVGTVVDFIDDIPIVCFDGVNHIIMPHTWTKEADGDNKQLYHMTQIPLLLAYALTIHRCQGMTLNQASIVLNEKIFEAGQAYVALSRLKSINNLTLLDFKPDVFRVNKMVKQYYTNFKSSKPFQVNHL